MPQIAQQDYKLIYIKDLANVSEAEQLEIGKAVNQGIIHDCLIATGSEGQQTLKIIAVDPDGALIKVYDLSSGNIIAIEYLD